MGIAMSEDATELRQNINQSATPIHTPKPWECARVWANFKMWINQNLLLILTLFGVLAGFGVGLAIRCAQPSVNAIMWIGLPSELFLRLLNLLILPLIVCSVISGMATIEPKCNGKISLIALVFIVISNIICSAIGVLVSFIIPTVKSQDDSSSMTSSLSTQDIFADLLRNLFPDNIISASFSQVQTKHTSKLLNMSNGTTYLSFQRSLSRVHSPNLIGIMVISFLVAIAANKSGDKARPFLAWFSSASHIFLILLRWVLWFTPIGVFSLITSSLVHVDSLDRTFSSVGYFVLAVIVGLCFHQLIVMPLIYFVFIRQNPYSAIVSLARPWLLGFATTSTAVAIPEMCDIVETQHSVDKRVSRFVIPFSVTLSANGSAIFIAASVLFMAHVNGAQASHADYLIVLGLTAISAMSIPSVPSASIVTLLIIMTSIGIPQKNVGLFFAVEWLLDRIRTTSNVLSHSFCSIIVYRICRKDLYRPQPLLNCNDNS